MTAQAVRRTIAITAAAVVAPASTALAVPGDLDPTFSRDGVVRVGFSAPARAAGVAIDADGRLVVAGSVGTGDETDPLLIRLKPNGKLDRSFGKRGRVTLPRAGGPDRAEAVGLAPDGRIIVAATIGDQFAVARFLPNGALDQSFADDGIAEPAPGLAGIAYDLAVATDGSVLAAGTIEPSAGPADFVVARLSPIGSLDPAFAGDGVAETDFHDTADGIAKALVIEPDDEIVAVGRVSEYVAYGGLAVARYEPDGDLDPDFSGDGKLRLDPNPYGQYAEDVALTAAGAITIAGCCPTPLRLEPDGDFDPSFGNGGRAPGWADFEALALDGQGRAVTVQNVGGCYRGCIQFDYVLERFTAEGRRDRTFSGDSRAWQDVARRDNFAYDLALQANGRIVAVGSAGEDVAVLRHEVVPGKPDADGDGIRDDDDRCIGRYGKRHGGCPRFVRKLTFRRDVQADLFHGNLSSREAKCVNRRQVRVLRAKPGSDLLLHEVRTGSDGRWEVDASLLPGRYYAVVERDKHHNLGICRPARSNEIEIR